MTARGPASAGFSLIEMLVSLVVLGVTALLFAGGIGRVGQGLSLANQTDARVDLVATAQFVLRQRLAGIQPVPETQTGNNSIDFVGLDGRVDFIADPADHDAPDALYYYRIARDPDGDLVLFSVNTLDQRIDVHNPATVGWTAHPLVPGTAGIEIRYLGRLSAGSTPGLMWQDNWTHRDTLPQLVRVRVSFPVGDTRVWPDLIVHPRATTADTCPQDSLSDDCTRAGNT
ncbi:prepilin-type N-terminal cleavage/methylation domain-containing protein [Novosphingobium sp.]|uniref:prepilin-type N-terminal cleavage/methylation domain-containing protein n=1 Tax=Novosphingobium sp. TaxID=1874826 RepID=UPI003342B259